MLGWFERSSRRKAFVLLQLLNHRGGFCHAV